MATTVVGRKLLVGGDWIETGEWLDVRSPYSGDVVGRVAKAGKDETRRAIDAAERAMREPLLAHKRAEILVRVAGGLGRRHDEVARLISDEAGKPMKGRSSPHLVAVRFGCRWRRSWPASVRVPGRP